MDSINCKYCQNPLLEYATFCPRCGHETDSREAATSISEKIPTVILTLSKDEQTALSEKSLPHAYSDAQDNATYVSENIPTRALGHFSENTPTTMLENVSPLAKQVETEDDDEDNGILFIPIIPGPTAGAPLVNGVPQISGAPSIPGAPPHIGAPPTLSGPPQVSGLPGIPLANIPPSTFPHGYPAPAQPGGGPIKPGTGGKGCIPWVAGISLLLVLIIVLMLLFPPFGSQPSAAQAQINILTSSLNSSMAYPGGSIKLHGQNFLPGGTVTFQENGQQVQTGGLASNTTYQSISSLVLSQTLIQQDRPFQTTATVQADGTFDCSFSIPVTWPADSTHPVVASEQKNGKSASARVNITVHTAPVVQVTGTPTVTPVSTATDTPTTTDTPTPVPPTQVPPPPTTNPVTMQRQLSALQTQSKTVPATGKGIAAGTQASGDLVIHNSSRIILTLSKGTVITNGTGCGPLGLQMVLDSTVTLNPDTSGNYPAHVAAVGVAGNIPQQCTSVTGAVEPTFAYYHCPDNCDWDATSNAGAFSGGTDPQSYAVVQQSDIDNAAASLKTSTTQTATANIQSQLHSNEHLIGTPQCNYNVSADHKAGDAAGRVTVTVVATCTATAST